MWESDCSLDVDVDLLLLASSGRFFWFWTAPSFSYLARSSLKLHLVLNLAVEEFPESYARTGSYNCVPWHLGNGPTHQCLRRAKPVPTQLIGMVSSLSHKQRCWYGTRFIAEREGLRRKPFLMQETVSALHPTQLRAGVAVPARCHSLERAR